MGDFLVLDWVTNTPITVNEKVVCIAVTENMEGYDAIHSAVSKYEQSENRAVLLDDIEIAVGLYNMYGWVLDDDGGYELSRPDTINGKTVHFHNGLRYIAWSVFKEMAKVYNTTDKALKNLSKEDILKIVVAYSKEAQVELYYPPYACQYLTDYHWHQKDYGINYTRGLSLRLKLTQERVTRLLKQIND